MPPEERGFSQGLPHAASRLGAALTPPLVVLLMIHFGWRMPFFLFGLLGLAWAATWYWYYRDRPADHRSVNADELAVIHQPESAAFEFRAFRALADNPEKPHCLDAGHDVFLLWL